MPTRARSCTTSMSRVVDVLAVERDLARDAAARDGVVHAVEAAQEGRLAAARGADQRGHLRSRGCRGRRRCSACFVAVEHVDVARRHLRRCDGSPRSRRGAGIAAVRVGPWLVVSWHRHATHQRRSKRLRSADRQRRSSATRKASSTMIARRGLLDEAALRAVGPQVDLHRQRGGRVGEAARARRRRRPPCRSSAAAPSRRARAPCR